MKCFSILILLFFCFCKIDAQDSTQTNGSILWEISGKNLQEKSYLLGTLHLRCSEDFKIPKIVKETIKKCKAFFEETNFYEPIGFMQQIESYSWKYKLDSIIGDSLFKVADKIFYKKTKLPLSIFNFTKPFFTTQYLTYNAYKCKKVISMEQELFKFADKNNLDVYGLESQKEHFDVINELTDTFQVNYLLYNIFYLDSVNSDLKNITEQFKSNSFFQKSSTYFNDSNYVKNVFDSVMLFKRNENWLSTIKFRMNLRPTFFAFGASHLASEKGIVALLKKEGYTLTPIPY